MINLTDIDEIEKLLTRHGFRFSKSMGQNFLTAKWVPEQIAEESNLDEKTAVLEIGPGIGCLTVQLAERAGKVLSVELDEKLIPILGETLQGRDNIEVLFGNILKKDIPELVEENFEGYRPVVCANLPYNITSPILAKLLESKCFDTITVMVQKEVALRICSDCAKEDYSAFSVFCQWYAEPKILFDVGPECFVPRPKVVSSVVKFDIRKEPPAEVLDEKLFFNIVKAAFSQRRKTLVNAMSSGLGSFTKSDIQKAIENVGLPADIRGERLNINEFAQICNYLTRMKVNDLYV